MSTTPRLRPSVLDHLAQAAAMPRGHRPHTDTTTWATAHLYEVDTVRNRALISVYGGDPQWVPALPSTYTGMSIVHVRMDRGRAVLVEGPTTAAPLPEPEPDPDEGSTDPESSQPPPPPKETAPRYETLSTVVRPGWSGTWSDKWAKWGGWYGNQVGYPWTLYQGDAFGSGRVLGLAVYGTQVKALGAVEITAMDVQIVGAGTGYGFTPTVQGSAHGTKPTGRPTATGPTADKGQITPSGKVRIPLPASVREDFRTGAVRGLRLHGSTYGGARGTDHGEGMALRITYRKQV